MFSPPARRYFRCRLLSILMLSPADFFFFFARWLILICCHAATDIDIAADYFLMPLSDD